MFKYIGLCIAMVLSSCVPQAAQAIGFSSFHATTTAFHSVPVRTTPFVRTNHVEEEPREVRPTVTQRFNNIRNGAMAGILIPHNQPQAQQTDVQQSPPQVVYVPQQSSGISPGSAIFGIILVAFAIGCLIALYVVLNRRK